MKKLIMMSAMGVALLLGACSGGGKADKNDSTQAEEMSLDATLPVTSGEYRVVSFQDTAAGAVRTRFDGRMLMALDPGNAGIYIYENGNRTHFKAKAILSKMFEQKDSIYVATDKDNREITLIPGKDVDTLIVYRGNVPVKVSFESKPMSALTPAEVWTRISAQLSK
jgi:lipoprotein